MSLKKIVNGITWVVMALTVGLSPIWAGLSAVLFLLTLLSGVPLFGLTLEMTLLVLALIFFIFFGLIGVN